VNCPNSQLTAAAPQPSALTTPMGQDTPRAVIRGVSVWVLVVGQILLVAAQPVGAPAIPCLGPSGLADRNI